MNKICTTIEQSNKLLSLGLDPSTADMGWNIFVDGTIRLLPIDDWDLNKDGSGNVKLCYAWSLTALLELMPKSICIKKTDHSGYFYFLEWQIANDNSLRYVGHNGECLIDIYSDHDDNWKDFIDTAFEMICWLIEQRHIEVNK